MATTFEIISSIYFDKLINELESVLDDLANDIYGLTDYRLSTRRQSDFALSGKLKEKITKTKSKSNLEKNNSTAANGGEPNVSLYPALSQTEYLIIVLIFR